MNVVHELRRRGTAIVKRLSRRWYWELRAPDIEERYGRDVHDHTLLYELVKRVDAHTILDVGCGMGRLFPGYLKAGVDHATALDLSRRALAQAQRRFPQPIFSFTNQPILSLAPAQPFDLCVTTRALSAVTPKQISETLRVLARVSKHIYLNEYTLSDGGQPSDYWFLHDYLSLLRQHCTFTCIEQGRLELATYYLLRIDSLTPTASNPR